MVVTCPSPTCAETFEWAPNVDQCPYCGSEIKKPSLPAAHFVQLHKTDKYGPPATGLGYFQISTDKSVDGLHGSTIWLISGGGSPKKYFLESYFVVDAVGDYPDDQSEFKSWARGRRGRKMRPLIPLDSYQWFQDLRATLPVFSGRGLSEIGSKTVEELRRLVPEKQRRPTRRST